MLHAMRCSSDAPFFLLQSKSVAKASRYAILFKIKRRGYLSVIAYNMYGLHSSNAFFTAKRVWYYA
jgi:hypothetical protein